MLRRRAFLGTLAAAVAGAAFDPERLLWVPGRKTIVDLAGPRLAGLPYSWSILTEQVTLVTQDITMPGIGLYFDVGQVLATDEAMERLLGEPLLTPRGRPRQFVGNAQLTAMRLDRPIVKER